LARAFAEGVSSGSERITVGVQHFFRTLEVNGYGTVRVVLWDLGGEHRFRFLAPIFLKGAHGVVYVFDIARDETFLDLEDWRSVAESVLGRVPSVLVGNKKDLEELRTVPREVAENYARAHGFIGYYEVSAAKLLDVEKPFLDLVVAILARG